MLRPWSLHGLYRRIALVLVPLLLLTELVVVIPALAQAPPPTLTVNPTSAIAGQSITLIGSNFAPGSGIVLWDGVEAAKVDIPQLASFSLPFTIPDTTSSGLHSITLCAGDPCTAQSASTTIRIDLQLSDVPADLRRRAQQFLEEMRSSPMAPGWERAILGPAVRPLYRPDLEGPAYYEFIIQISNTPQAPSAIFLPRYGFMILSSGEHDAPIAHWNYTGDSPTQILERMAIVNQQPLIARFHKLDTLAYAAEDANGNQVAYLGSQLTKISGQDPAWLNQPTTLSEQIWTPDQQNQDDSNTTQISGTLVTSGPNPPSALQMGGWSSWNELKVGYAQSYAVQLESQRRMVSTDWQIEKQARQIGEALRKGNTYTFAFLSNDLPAISLSGSGVSMVQTKLLTRTGLPALLQIEVLNSVPLQELPLNVEVTYTDGTTETMKFQVIEPATHTIYLPLIGNGVSRPATQSRDQSIGLQGAWGAWTYYWAGNSGDQRLYSQIPSDTTPNSSGCWSGCGATAWAMLFGWADNQAASGNSYWAGRFGLYRQNGGYGADAVAPRTMDTGVRTMTWELRNRIGTFCAFGNGATAPWTMGNASGYLAGRTGTRLSTHYNVLGIQEGRLREYARDSIRDRGTPAIIGTGWLTHYPLAYGYAWRSRETQACVICPWTTTEYSRWFYVNQGWGGSGDGWVSAGTWFAGEIYP